MSGTILHQAIRLPAALLSLLLLVLAPLGRVAAQAAKSTTETVSPNDQTRVRDAHLLCGGQPTWVVRERHQVSTKNAELMTRRDT